MFFKKKKVTVKIQGGLGNQLFQIAAVLHYAKRKWFKAVFSKDKTINNNGGEIGAYTYWDVFNSTNVLQTEEIDFSNYKTYRETSFKYQPFKRKRKNTCLLGYYQSPIYVDCVKQEMLNFLWSNLAVNKQVDKLYDEIVGLFNTEDLISVHIRRGDYIALKDIHPIQPIRYYVEAIKTVSETAPVIVFSNDQEWCKEELEKEIGNPLFFVSDKDYVEILLMSKIKNNIIANSSFSWWSAYINEHKDKKVIAPKQWFGPKWQDQSRCNDWSDIYCDHWVKK